MFGKKNPSAVVSKALATMREEFAANEHENTGLRNRPRWNDARQRILKQKSAAVAPLIEQLSPADLGDSDTPQAGIAPFLVALLEEIGDPTALPALFELLPTYVPNVDSAIASMPGGIELALSHIDSNNPRIRAGIADVVGASHKQTPASREALVRLLGDGDGDVQLRAVTAALVLQDRSADIVQQIRAVGSTAVYPPLVRMSEKYLDEYGS
jgi:HEAT repeat protein